jgi:AmmeMemoRadiSam system protein B
MTQVREAAVAGLFYPADAGELSETVRSMLSNGQPAGSAPRALIVPHAGYVYSGPVAATAYASLIPFARRYRRVVLLGPCHRAPLTGLASSSADAFRTPLGDVPLDQALIASLGPPSVAISAEAHRLEHSLEVQLPFLQTVLGEFTLVPLAVGDTAPEHVAEVIDALWNEPRTLFVVSSDLSHYLPYANARRRDEATCNAIEQLHSGRISHADACGATAVAGLLIVAARHNLAVRTLDLRNSGDTAGSKDQVVGYGSWVFEENKSCELAA